MFFLYQLILLVLIFFSPIIFLFRILKNKEHKKRFTEKFSLPSKKRSNGKLIWFHGASVGEILSIIPIIKNYEKDKNINQILLTTSTLSSSKVLGKFKFKKTIHQFYPIDSFLFTNKFLKFWKPSLAVFVDSEIWPEMLRSLKKRKIKTFLLNARISKNSFYRWKYFKDFGINIFSIFDYIFPQNKETFNYLKYFKVKKMKILGNLKFTESERIDANKSFQTIFYRRKILCAASTHNNEEELISTIHLDLKNKIDNLLTIIIPRHIERSKEIIETLNFNKLKYVCHSENKKVKKDTDVYLVDTYGESNSFYSLSKVVFLGGSFVPRGGQNPLEPIRYGCYLTHGKHTFNFTEIYNMLKRKKLSFEAKNYTQLKKIILNLLIRKSKNKNEINKFKKIGNNILNKYFTIIRVLI